MVAREVMRATRALVVSSRRLYGSYGRLDRVDSASDAVWRAGVGVWRSFSAGMTLASDTLHGPKKYAQIADF